MNNWMITTLGACVSLLGDGLHGTPIYSEDGDYYFINGNNLSEGKIVIKEDTKRVSESEYKKYKKNLNDRTILVSINGTLGNVGTYNNEKVILGKSACYFNVKPNIDKSFIKYTVSTNTFKYYSETFATGATIKNLSLAQIKKYKFQLPPLPTQQKIASILSAYDNLIQNYKKQIEALQTAASELYKEWFVRFRFPGWQTTKSENGIPDGWSICRLKDFGKVITGKTPPTEKEEYYGGDVMFVKTPDMHGNMFVQSTSEYISKLGCEYQKAQYLPENSIMVSCIGTGGITAINAYPANTNQQINSIILEDKKYLPWLYFTVSNMKETIEMFGNTGTTMTNLSKGKFEKLKVVKPEYSIIQTFENKVSPLFEQIKNLNKQITNLTQQRDLLLPRLMSGKISL